MAPEREPDELQATEALAAEHIFSDGLLGCLEFIAAYHDRSVPPGALTAGLPLTGGKLTPRLFARAAARAGLSARIVRRPLNQLSALLLPAILLLDGDEAVVLTQELEGNSVQVVVPETGRGVVTVPAEELADSYSGYAILIKPEYRFSRRDETGWYRAGKDWFWSAVKPLWPTYVQVLLAAALINILALATPLFIMNVYDRVLPNKALPTLWVLATGVVLAITFDFLLKMLRNHLIGNAGRRADVLLASRLFAHVLNLDLGQRPMKTGEFANQLRDFEIVREFFTSSTVVTLTDFVFIWLFIFIIFQIAGVVALVPAFAVMLVLVVGVLLQFPLRRIVRQAQTEATHRHSLLIEALTGLESIKTSRAESQFQDEWERFVGRNARTAEKLRGLSALSSNLTAFVQQLVTVGVVVVGVYLFDQGEVSPGAIIAAVILAGRAVAPLGQIAATIGRSQQALYSLRTLNQFMAVRGEDEGQGRHINRSVGAGSVAFDKVSFTYPGAEVLALRNVTFRVEPGERVGIIGRIGSGKTTLGRLIARLYLPSEGSLLIDDVEIRQYHPEEVRSRVAFVSQDASLFHGTVRDNIVLGTPNVSDDLVIRAADLAGVSQFVKLHPQGFNMQVGESGRLLSSGQRQMIALARAFLADPLVVFLDEPSGSMDPASELALLERLNTAFRPDQTLIITTHRTAMLALVSRLIVVENGRIAADGPRDTVLKALRMQADSRASGNRAKRATEMQERDRPETAKKRLEKPASGEDGGKSG